MGELPGGADGYRGLIRSAHLARPRRRADPPGRPRPDRAHRRRAHGPRRSDHRRLEPRRCAVQPAQRPRLALRDPRRGLRQGRMAPRPRHRGDPRLVRAPARDPVRGRPHGRARGGALDDRVLPPAGARRLEARPVLRQHVAPEDAPALRGRGARLPRGRSPGTTCRSRSRRSCRDLPDVPPPPRGRPRSSRAGRSTPSASPTRWASTAATSTGSACSRSTRGARARLVVDTGHARPGLDARPGRSTFMLEHTALAPEQHRQRGRPLHRLARPGARLQARPARDAAAARRGRAKRLGARFDIREFHDACSGAARSRCRSCAASSRLGPRVASLGPRPGTTMDRRRTLVLLQRRPPIEDPMAADDAPSVLAPDRSRQAA